LLGKWDEARGVERVEVYRGFLLPQKLKLLSQVAAETFERGQYFFTQDMIEQHIGNYLRQLPNASPEPEEIEQQSLAVLKAIESQHGLLIERSRGVFSFSYLVFQEYLTARKIVNQSSLQSNQALEGLVTHISDPQWREVFLLTVTMLPNADELIQCMKHKINQMVEDPDIREFLDWQITNLESSKISPPEKWHFNKAQKQILKCYYAANQLLFDCLNTNCEITMAIKQEVEIGILLGFPKGISEQSLMNNFGGDRIKQEPRSIRSLPLRELAISAR
jgi:hypothetical protein